MKLPELLLLLGAVVFIVFLMTQRAGQINVSGGNPIGPVSSAGPYIAVIP